MLIGENNGSLEERSSSQRITFHIFLENHFLLKLIIMYIVDFLLIVVKYIFFLSDNIYTKSKLLLLEVIKTK